MDKYVCTVCGFVYDPEVGVDDEEIDLGTPFEEIPEESFICPICGAGKGEFRQVKEDEEI
ncbi:MAG: rubredoxin [Candidatus Avilachnospira sp.]|jgi:rubredoxin